MKLYKLTLLIPIILFTISCKKNELQQYSEKPAVYFAQFSDKDSLVHSLVGSVADYDTVFVTLKLLGHQLETDRNVRVEIDQDYTTAKEGLHYEKLKDNYVFPANKFTIDIPIVLYKTDPELAKKEMKIGLKIVQSPEMGVGYPDKATAHILFTNQLVKPVYWDNFLVIYYGVYSKVKHQKCIEFQGFDFPAAMTQIPPSEIGVLMSYGRVLSQYFTDNLINDENGNRIMPWAAF